MPTATDAVNHDADSRKDGADGAPAEILIAGPLLPELMQRIEAKYRVHRWWEIADTAAFLKAHGASIRGIATSGRYGATRTMIESLPALEAIVSFGVGIDPIDMEAAREHDVVVTNTPGVLDDCVADTALALMLAVSRRICELDRFVRAGRWRSETPPMGRKLGGRRCGILGLGNIGRQIARRAEAFGMDIAYHNRTPRRDVPAHFMYCEDIHALARASDVMVLAVPGGSGTQRVVDAGVLDALGPQGILVNVARGSVVDQDALVCALREGRLGGAGLDVFENEPEVPEALCAMDQVVLSPHIGSSTVETRQAMADLVMANLDGWFERRRPLTPVA
ncbi:hydroxyacid dehydrogenase [Bordetella genomosp. 8]|uniref:Hydroxyacid dehydrogenase n=1 Tax=Bordetella genomosp. 8 TaxID=1416806 RepID=A0A1W6YHV8_9BORD|nr:2-hydroxyacid dehydrogenase [Bordetella genomosp. 8]ARP80574.1 hydroxyacid dehydrogenase [Bordetella genomosp. 8]